MSKKVARTQAESELYMANWKGRSKALRDFKHQSRNASEVYNNYVRFKDGSSLHVNPDTLEFEAK